VLASGPSWFRPVVCQVHSSGGWCIVRSGEECYPAMGRRLQISSMLKVGILGLRVVVSAVEVWRRKSVMLLIVERCCLGSGARVGVSMMIIERGWVTQVKPRGRQDSLLGASESARRHSKLI
jgi:hypothetical protein